MQEKLMSDSTGLEHFAVKQAKSFEDIQNTE